jgi:hypothetical protein
MPLLIGIIGTIIVIHLFIKEGKARAQYFENKAANPRPWYHFHDYSKDTKRRR